MGWKASTSHNVLIKDAGLAGVGSTSKFTLLLAVAFSSWNERLIFLLAVDQSPLQDVL